MAEFDIQTQLQLDDSLYNVETNLPLNNVTQANPYKLKIQQDALKQDLFKLAVGGTDPQTKQENVFLTFCPPASIFPQSAALSQQSLTIQISTGSFTNNNPFDSTQSAQPNPNNKG
jgi:hypothetical protein